ncbi:hypothetical protein PJ985_20460 [Streptomyces sp. ACA25]|uniref:hypothetical protein n=1 Tax=Streptomyces sp. ACA25 TaxID=3022596 RepID=UPI00230787A3|nr:hypothetical protein [Streptomyces sp. ACA25]MDB1089934.1 hypothetical protein [Streptomyces sp. ACA25]
MLTVQTRFPSPVPLPVPDAVRCVCLAYVTEDGRSFRLGRHPSTSAWGAMLWLSWRAAHIADQLDPPAARRVRAGLADEGTTRRALEQLGRGEPYLLAIHDGPVHYLLSATPVGAVPGAVPAVGAGSAVS